MTYKDGLPVEVVAEPSYGEQPFAPTKEQMQGSVDPLSGVIAMMLMPTATAEAPCGTEVPVYDGRRRYSFDMTSQGWATVEGSGVGGYSGVALHCQAKYRRIAGWDAERLARKTETVVDAYFAPVGQRADGLPLFYLPLRFWGDAEVGDVVARPKSVTINGMPWEQYFAQARADRAGETRDCDRARGRRRGGRPDGSRLPFMGRKTAYTSDSRAKRTISRFEKVIRSDRTFSAKEVWS